MKKVKVSHSLVAVRTVFLCGPLHFEHCYCDHEHGMEPKFCTMTLVLILFYFSVTFKCTSEVKKYSFGHNSTTNQTVIGCGNLYLTPAITYHINLPFIKSDHICFSGFAWSWR